MSGLVLPSTIVIATGNPHKVQELRELLSGLYDSAHESTDRSEPWPVARVRIIGLKDLPGHEKFFEPEEHGTSFVENARIKALSYAKQTGMMCLADDSGLEIDALGGRPGVISSHYCTDGREEGMDRGTRDRLNNERVLRELDELGVAAEKRTARFVCCMALGSPEGKIVLESRGKFEGRIGMGGEVPRGENGFGYDPLFLVGTGFERTSAELSEVEKNRVSHRGRAVEALQKLCA